MPVDTSIILGVKPLQLPDTSGDASKMIQMQGLLNQNAASEMALEKGRREHEGLTKMMAAITAKGGPSDPMVASDAMIQSGVPHYIDMGLKLRQAAAEAAKYQAIMSGGAPSSNALAPQQSAGQPPPANNLAPQSQAAPTDGSVNALAPQPAVSKNDLAIAELRRKRDALLAMGTTQSIAAADKLNSDITILSKPPVYHTVEGVGLVDPSTGRVVTPSQMTPYQKAKLPLEERQVVATERNADTSAGHLSVARGQLKVAQDRLAKEGVSLSPEDTSALATAILDGRLDPNRVTKTNAKIIASTLKQNPDANILELGVAGAGALAGERALSTQSAKITTAANEARNMTGLVREYSAKVDRTKFPTINSIENAVAKGTGDTAIVDLNTSINALVNSYARAINPTGVATVSDKNHAREIINSAYADGQINSILNVMDKEMAFSQNAPVEARAQAKAARTGKPAPAASGKWEIVK